jgi:glutamyl-tRNA reductase
VQRINNVYLYNIDDLEAIVRENVRNRQQDLVLCNQIIETGAGALMEKLNYRKEQPHNRGFEFQPMWISHGTAIAQG